MVAKWIHTKPFYTGFCRSLGRRTPVRGDRSPERRHDETSAAVASRRSRGGGYRCWVRLGVKRRLGGDKAHPAVTGRFFAGGVGYWCQGCSRHRGVGESFSRETAGDRV